MDRDSDAMVLKSFLNYSFVNAYMWPYKGANSPTVLWIVQATSRILWLVLDTFHRDTNKSKITWSPIFHHIISQKVKENREIKEPDRRRERDKSWLKISEEYHLDLE